MTKDEMKMTFTQTITRDEMKNRISMALKEDPISQQGLEIICKKLAELEKENAELKEKIRLQNEQEAKDIRARFVY